MSDVLFDNGIDALVEFGAWGVLTIGLYKANAWTPDATGDGVIADITGAGATELAVSGYARLHFIIGNIAFDNPGHRVVFSLDTIDFGTPDTGADYDWLVIASEGTDDTDSKLIVAYDLTGSTTDGLPLSFDPDASGSIEIVNGS